MKKRIIPIIFLVSLFYVFAIGSVLAADLVVYSAGPKSLSKSVSPAIK